MSPFKNQRQFVQADLKDPVRETHIFARRAWVCLGLVIVMYLVLLGRAFYLQVVQHDVHSTKSDSNRVLVQPIPPNRGLILDRNGVLLAENRPDHSLSITPERVKDIDAALAEVSQIIALTPAEIERFKERLKEYRRPFEPVPIKSSLTESEIARVAVDIHRLEGISIEARLVRYYPRGESTAHVLGYVGRINQRELAAINTADYAGTNNIGKIGLEKFYEADLLGQVGYQRVEINARGRVLNVIERNPPEPGNDLRLFFDVQLQQVAEQVLGDRRGAVVMMDTRTGGILVMASTPAFDPNLFVNGIGRKAYAKLRDSLDLPLFNRALRGQYPPGSTTKPFFALGAVELGLTDWQETIFDPGFYQLTEGGRFYRDWKRHGHGRVDLRKSIIESCDTFYYQVAHRMEIDPMADFMAQFGFGQKIVLDAAEALRGVNPSSAWKRGAIGEPWYTGDSLNVSIGQGYMLATPLQLAAATAVLANQGRWVIPRLKSGFNNEQDVPAPPPLPDIQAKADNWERVIEAMVAVVHGEKGTAKGISRGITYRIAGKTGTAQVIGIKQDEEYDEETIAERNKDHALFMGFAPAENPEVAIAVIVENGGGGGSTAAPVARKVLDAYFAQNPEDEQLIEQAQLVSNSLQPSTGTLSQGRGAQDG